MDQVHEDGAVGQDPVGDLDVPRPLELAGEEFAADGVPDVVGQEPEPVEAELGAERHGHIGLVHQPIGAVGLGRQSEPGEVEEDDPPAGGQGVDHPVEVERRRREAVEHQQRRAATGPSAGTSTVNIRCAAECEVTAPGPPGLDQWFTCNPLSQEPGAEQVQDLVERLAGGGAGPVVEVLGQDRVGPLAVPVRIAGRRVEFHADEAVAEQLAQGGEPLGRGRLVAGEAQAEHADAGGHPLDDPVGVGVADPERRRRAGRRGTAGTAG